MTKSRNRENINTRVEIGTQTENIGNSQQTKKIYLEIKGEYKFKFFAHCKTLKVRQIVE